MSARRALTVGGLSLGYGRRRVVEGLHLQPLEPGQMTALVGPNGAGKSTILRGLAGLIPGRGTMRLGELDLAALSIEARARHVAYMPQTLPQGVALSVLEALVGALRAVPPAGAPLSADAATERALALLRRLGIEHLALTNLDSLSGGQRQLAGLAQALVREPEVLLLDEPTSALDLRYQLSVMGLVRELTDAHRLVTVVVLHDLGLAARFADRVVVLRDGAVRFDGPAERTLTPAMLAEVYGVSGRVERCSRDGLMVLADAALPAA